MEKTIVTYPGLATSHFVPMMELADLLLDHGYGVAVALIDCTLLEEPALAAAVDRAAASRPSISFHRLPRVQHTRATSLQDEDFLLWYMELVGLCNGRLRDLLRSMPPGRTVHAIVVDALSAEALGVAEELGVPGYIFQTANAGALSFFLHLPWIRGEGQPSFKEMGDTIVELPGLAPMPASHLEAEVLRDPESETYKAMVSLGLRWHRSDGFIVNTFESLDARAVSALRHPRRLPPGVVPPPLYCVGPLVQNAGAGASRQHDCLAWLDGQPDRSVVFLCFGSLAEASHSEEQIKEIAAGLEKSGHQFLWVVRDPHNANDDPDLGALLPEGFLDQTGGHGLVVKAWAPQVDVLQHRATAAFATHCGWNSVLEGVTAGVPMLAWPLYAEQRMNKVLLVEDLRVAVEMVGWRQGLVRADEVEAKVRLAVESRELRERVSVYKEGAAVAWSNGGSSRLAFEKFLSDLDGRQQLSRTRCGDDVHGCAADI